MTWYPWTLNNKYYTADVRLCTVPSPFQMTAEIAQSMQAFIAYFDSTAVGLVVYITDDILIMLCDRMLCPLLCFYLFSRVFCCQKDGLDKLSPWISVVEDLGPEVLILVCDRVCEQGLYCLSSLCGYLFDWLNVMQSDGLKRDLLLCVAGVSRHAAQQWCLAHAFELVELNPQDLPDEDGNECTTLVYVLLCFFF